MTKPKVLVGFAIYPAALERLAEEAEVLGPGPVSADDYWALLPEAEGVILSSRPFGAAEMERGRNLAVLGRYGVGYDNVDVEAATARGLPLVYTPFGPTESTAELAFLLIMAVARRLPRFERAARANEWGLQAHPELMGRELEGKTLGVVGFGRIGQRVAEMARLALRMRILVYDPCVDAQHVALLGATRVDDLLTLAGQADVLTIHCPAGPETHHLIHSAVLRAMKPEAILVNTSRGPVVDEAALIEALREGRLMGAGLDVFDPEPPAPDNPLLAMDNVVVLPHIGSFTHEGRRRMGLTVVEEVLRVLRDERPRYLANPEVWERRRRPTGSARPRGS
jgi:gluconate 2-dehydrogenase